MPEHKNVQCIRSAYDAFTRGDLDGALGHVAPDAVFHYRGTGALSGDHLGHDEIREVLVGSFLLTGGTQLLDVQAVYADDDYAVVVVHETATRTDGLELDANEVHLVALNAEGRITNLWDIPDDPEAHDLFFDIDRR